MFRYLALVWSASDERQSGTARLLSERVRLLSPPWHTVFDAAGMRVFCTDARPASLAAQVLPDRHGVILGALFRRNGDVADDAPSPKALLNTTDAAAVVTSRGRWLVQHCWGDYVAFLADPASRSKWVLKAPSGDLPCFSTRFAGVTLIFSAITDCLDLELRFTLNREYLFARVMSGGEELAPLHEVQRIYRGQCIEIDASTQTAVRSKHMLWNPLDFSTADAALEDPDQAARAMRAVVHSCTHTWAACHENFLLRLSGGLDSSIVAGCLRDTAARPICYTYYNPAGRSDERPWARLAAQFGNHRHIECPMTPADIHLETLLELHPMVEPVAALGFLHRSTLEKQLVEAHAASAVFNGDGGDSGFCSDSLVYAVPEYLQRRGLRREVLQLAARVALRRQQSSWEVLLRSFKMWLLGDDMQEHQELVLMVSQLASRELRERLAAPARYPHPWFQHTDRVPWATIRRIGMLAYPPEFYNVIQPTGPAPEVLSPLYTQPVMEILLRIPLYTHFENGQDRGLARRAFAADVPQPILQRLWKDRGPGFHDELLHRNRGFLRELFLDGVLVREGLLDQRAVEQALGTGPSRSTVLTGEIFKQMEIELWARQWLHAAARVSQTPANHE